MLDLLYPKHCPVCLDTLPPGKTLICPPCREKIRYVKSPVCYKCGKPLRDETKELCRNCRAKLPPFTESFAWAEYSSEYMRRMISRVKYHGECQLLDFPCEDMGRRYFDKVRKWAPEALIPVPVHETRRRERGYNQAEEMAERLSEIWKIPVDSKYLVRSEKTSAQKELGSTDRIKNLSGAFSVSGEKGKYKKVLLIDDIYTTGSTFSVCTGALLSAGVSQVYGAVLLIGRD